MKKTLLLFILAIAFNIVQAQFKPVAEGPTFEEPQDGFAKILQLKTGNTIFIHITNKDGIDTRIYNSAHKETVTNHINPTYDKLGTGSSIEGAFEINGDVVLMVSKSESRTPTLYRIIIDGKTGAAKEDKQIAQLAKVGFFAGYAMAFGNVPQPDFFVRKDPQSDNYALVLFNSFESERSKRIEIISYGADNKESGRAFYSSPNEKYKYIRYVDMAVIGNDKVSVLAYGYNTANSGGKESELILANLDKGATTVSFTELGFSQDLLVQYGICRYNPVIKSLVMIALTKEKSGDNGFTPMMALVNPFDKKINRVNIISPSERLDQYSKKGFRGLPQNLFINDDGTFTVVSEEVAIVSSKYSVSTELGDIAIVNYSKTGEPLGDFLIRKKHILNNSYLTPFYLSYREGTAQRLVSGNQFKSFAYLDGKTKSYILFNDTERNNEKQETGSLVGIQGVSGCDGFYYALTGKEPILTRNYVFGNPEGKKDHNLGLFSISDYDRKNNVYVTLELANQNGKKNVNVVWLQP
jgi:hypothetical protein